MKNYKKYLLLVLPVTFVSGSLQAADVPRASERDSRIQYVQYRENDVVLLNSVVGTGSRIVFSQDETIVNIASGFTQGWQFEPVKNELYVSSKSLQLVEDGPMTRPIPGEWDTNLMVTTTRGLYDFDIRLIAKDGRRDGSRAFYRIEFEYPLDARPELSALTSANNSGVVPAHGGQALRPKPAALPTKVETDLTKRLPPRNDQYTMSIGRKSKSIAPEMAYDDGLFTYLKFPENLDIPTAYLVRNNGSEEIETLVNGHVDPDRPEFIVLHRVAKKIRLRLDRAVVDVYNENFDPSGVSVVEGTTVPGVERVLK